MTAAARISVRATLLAMMLGLAPLAATLAGTLSAVPAAAHTVEVAAPSVPAPSGSGSVVSASPGTRVGGSPGAPEPGKPGWVWWVTAALVVILGVGGLRLWRSRDTEAGESDNPAEAHANPDEEVI